jgi:N-acetyltransferase
LKGDVAFSQPTQSGRKVMNTWGEGKVLVFNEDEQEDDKVDED